MPRFDPPLEQLGEYRTETAEPPGFDSWWRLRLDQPRAQARPPKLAKVRSRWLRVRLRLRCGVLRRGRRPDQGVVPAGRGREQADTRRGEVRRAAGGGRRLILAGLHALRYMATSNAGSVTSGTW
jgi:hypothetical protein